MHFLISILFLLLCMAVTFAYLVAGYFLARGVRFLFLRVRGHKEPFFVNAPKKKLYFSLTVVVSFYLTLYVSMHTKWCGDDNAHLEAKQYFAVGQTLAGLRLTVTKILNPDNPVLLPLNGLQRLIYLQGTRYLPKNDGEIGVWNDLWFNFPYVQRSTAPYGTSDTEPSYGMRKLLDSIWFSMEQMSTKPFADKQMEREQYFQNLPRMAFYYFMNKGHYHDRMIGSNSDLMQRPGYVDRFAKLYPWMVELRNRWIKDNFYEKIKQKRPKIEVLRQSVVVGVLGKLIESSIYSRSFNCGNIYIPLYIEARREFSDPNSRNFVWGKFHRQEKEQAELIYQGTIDSITSSFKKYIIEHYCGFQVPGKEAFFDKRDKKYFQSTRKDSVRYVFRNEIKIIEERRNVVQ